MATIPKSKATNAYDLLSEVSALILEDPKRYDQGRWLTTRTGENETFFSFPSCGTIGCVAGWVATLKETHVHDAQATAERILRLAPEEAFELFSSDAVDGISQTRAHAKSGAELIRRFQRKYATHLKATPV